MNIIDQLNPPVGEVSTILEVDATELFEGESVDWLFCVRRATFVHRDADACEFILYIGDPEEGAYWEQYLAEMEAFGCTQVFRELYRHAKELGVRRLLLYC